MATMKILALVRDLLLRSRIEAVAATRGVEINSASTLDLARTRATELSPTIIFADLSDANYPAEEIARTLRSVAPHARLVGFASHVDLKSIASARAAGFDLTLSRSEFTAQLPQLIK
jgi:DNA-binding NarL/FixJ family response regulator